jgi:2-keto-4-pentenoate hydratase
VTSTGAQAKLGLPGPSWGTLFDSMVLEDGAEVSIGDLLFPKIEPELAFVLKHRLAGPGVTPADVLAATEAVFPALEIADSRIDRWQMTGIDHVADGASSGRYLLGGPAMDPGKIDFAEIAIRLTRSGEPAGEGVGTNAVGTPLGCMAGLANQLGAAGLAIEAGEVVMSGALIAPQAVTAGEIWTMEVTGGGKATVQFIR